LNFLFHYNHYRPFCKIFVKIVKQGGDISPKTAVLASITSILNKVL
jgi:hypothetical protein